MSLATIAQELATKGRHGDSTLVHMTPAEVAGLAAIARAHGGDITINPDTGAPTATFSLRASTMPAPAIWRWKGEGEGGAIGGAAARSRSDVRTV